MKKKWKKLRKRRNLRITKVLILIAILSAFGMGLLAGIRMVDDPKPDTFLIQEKNVMSGTVRWVEMSDDERKIPQPGDLIDIEISRNSNGTFSVTEVDKYVILKIIKK